MKDISIVILAAGYGKRLKSNLIKVMHPIAKKPMIYYSTSLAYKINKEKPIVVIGYQSEKVKEYLGNSAFYVEQKERLGTGHAVMQALPFIKTKNVLVLYGDMPLLKEKTLLNLIELHNKKPFPISMLTVTSNCPMGFGRILRDLKTNNVLAIIEESQANKEQLSIKELNVGVYCFNTQWLCDNIKNISSSNGEYFLTDLIKIAVEKDYIINTKQVDSVQEVIGINTKEQLELAENIMKKRLLK